MITDPRTIPRTGPGRRSYAIGIGLLAVVLIAPQTTEFATKVAVLGALFLVCAIRPVLVLDAGAAPPRRRAGAPRDGRGRRCGRLRRARRARGLPRAARRGVRERRAGARALPDVTVLPSKGVATQLDRETAVAIARDVVADLGNEADAVLRRDPDLATAARPAPGSRRCGRASTPPARSSTSRSSTSST